MRLRGYLSGLVLTAVVPLAALAAGVTLATSPRLDGDDVPGFYEVAVRTVRLHRWSSIALIDLAGQPVLNTARPLGAALPNLADREYFRQVVATGRFYVSDLLRGRAVPSMDVIVAVPVHRRERLKYVLIAGLEPARIAEVLGGQDAGSGAFSVVVGGDGVVIARSPDHGQFVGQPLPAAWLAAMRATPTGRFRGRPRRVWRSSTRTSACRAPAGWWPTASRRSACTRRCAASRGPAGSRPG